MSIVGKIINRTKAAPVIIDRGEFAPRPVVGRIELPNLFTGFPPIKETPLPTVRLRAGGASDLLKGAVVAMDTKELAAFVEWLTRHVEERNAHPGR